MQEQVVIREDSSTDSLESGSSFRYVHSYSHDAFNPPFPSLHLQTDAITHLATRGASTVVIGAGRERSRLVISVTPMIVRHEIFLIFQRTTGD